MPLQIAKFNCRSNNHTPKRKSKMSVIKVLREKSGYSQADFAGYLGITRQTLIKYEKSPEGVPLAILKKLSERFDVGINDIVADRLPPEPKYKVIPSQKPSGIKPEIRIDIPEENIKKFKEVLLYVLERVGAKPNVGQTVIYKLLYFIDFDFYELYEKQLIGAKYIKNRYGPTPVDFAKIVRRMQKDNELEEIKSTHFSHEQTKYIPVRRADISILSALEIKHIDAVLEKYSDKSAVELSEYSHKDIPWAATKDRNIIPYESVFYRTPETSVRVYKNEV
jgi:transcriptional regulator with XRE-family HTH domain